MIDWFLTYQSQLWSGLSVTLALMVFALLIGFVLALLFSLLLVSGRRYLQAPVNAYIFFIRGTPLLVQFFLFYFGFAQFNLLHQSFLWPLLQQPFVCAVIALALNSAAYTTVLLGGAIRNVPQGEVEAGYALGMSRGLCLRRIILPRAWRNVLPAYSNEVVLVLKGTSLASTITLMDLMGVTRRIIAQTYTPMEGLFVAGVIYLMITAVIVTAFKMLERHYCVRT